MNMGKRFWTLFLSCILIMVRLQPLTFRTFSEEPTNTLETHLRVGLEQCDYEIDISSFHATRDEVVKTYQKLLEQEPLFFYVSKSFSYMYDQEGLILSVYPEYSMTKDEVETARSELWEWIQRVTQLVPSSFTDGDRAMFIYQYLGLNFTYSPSGDENYDVYSLVTEGHGVCQAFALAFVFMSRSVGLQADMVTSLSMDHAWNHVIVGGRCYHADVTRDLPTEDKKLTYTRFLLCDDAARSLGYEDYQCGAQHVCDDHTYEEPQEQPHQGILRPVSGTCLCAHPQWLCLTEDGFPVTVYLGSSDEGVSYRSDVIDLNGDQAFTLADILHAAIQQASDEEKPVTEALRSKLLSEILEASNLS